MFTIVTLREKQGFGIRCDAQNYLTRCKYQNLVDVTVRFWCTTHPLIPLISDGLFDKLVVRVLIYFDQKKLPQTNWHFPFARLPPLPSPQGYEDLFCGLSLCHTHFYFAPVINLSGGGWSVHKNILYEQCAYKKSVCSIMKKGTQKLNTPSTHLKRT